MALTPEDGSGVAGADTYATLAQADAYAAARGWSDWEGASVATREAALQSAAAWLDASFDWVGRIASIDQPLAWPRSGAFDKEGRRVSGIPTRLIDAQIELARLEIAGGILEFVTEGQIRKVKADSVSVEYVDGKRVLEGERTKRATRLLAGLYHARAGGNQVDVVRG